MSWTDDDAVHRNVSIRSYKIKIIPQCLYCKLKSIDNRFPNFLPFCTVLALPLLVVNNTKNDTTFVNPSDDVFPQFNLPVEEVSRKP